MHTYAQALSAQGLTKSDWSSASDLPNGRSICRERFGISHLQVLPSSTPVNDAGVFRFFGNVGACRNAFSHERHESATTTLLPDLH